MVTSKNPFSKEITTFLFLLCFLTVNVSAAYYGSVNAQLDGNISAAYFFGKSNGTICSSSQWMGGDGSCHSDADTVYNDTPIYQNISNIEGRTIFLENNASDLSGRVTNVESSKYSTTGGTINGNVLINGNLDVIGSYVNLTVNQQIVNGSIIPDLNSVFFIGSADRMFLGQYIKDLNASAIAYGIVPNTAIDSTYWVSHANLSSRGYLTSESDPQVDTTTNGNFCKGTGSTVSCTDSNNYLTAEVDGSTTNEIQNIITGGGLQRDGSNNFGLIECSAGQILKNQSGGWSCAADAGTTYTARTGGGINLDGSNSFALTECSDGQLLKNQSGGWACAADIGGTTYSAGMGLSLDSTTFNIDPSIVVNTSVQNLRHTVMSEPTGFPNRVDSVWGFTNSTRNLTISPASGSYLIFFDGIEHNISTEKSIIINDTEGPHIIYFDTDDTLKEYTAATEANLLSAIRDKVILAYIQWDNVSKVASYVGEERHGTIMDGLTQYYLHYTRGLQYVSGLGLGDFVIGDGSLDSHAQYSIASGSVSDEDLGLSIDAISSTTGLPILYRNGTGGDWRIQNQAGFGVYQNPSGTTNRLMYNQLTGGSWQLTEIGEANYVLYHVFASTGKYKQMYAVMGIAEYATLATARTGAQTEMSALQIASLPSPELRPIATVIYQTDKDYGNSINARVVEDTDGSDYVDWRSNDLPRGTTATDHGSLGGLSDDDHTQYLTEARGNTTIDARATGDIVCTGGASCSGTNKVVGADVTISVAAQQNIQGENITGGTINWARLPSGILNVTYAASQYLNYSTCSAGQEYVWDSGCVTNTAGTVTSITCGNGLSGGTITSTGTCAVNKITAANISTECSAGQVLKNISGGWDCANDANTTYTARGVLLNLEGTEFSVKEGTLTPNKGCSYVFGTGLVCTYDFLTTEVDGSTTNEIQNVITNHGLIRDGSNNFGLLACGNNQIVKNVSGSGYACAADADTTYTAGNGMVLAGTAFSVGSVSDGNLSANIPRLDAVDTFTNNVTFTKNVTVSILRLGTYCIRAYNATHFVEEGTCGV